MHVTRVSSTEQLRDLAGGWNCLTRGVPFRSWEWLATWWEHYGGLRRELYVLPVYDRGGALVGVAPWYAENIRSRGRVLRFLGSGAVCSDYLSVLSTHEHEEAVTAALAEWLVAAAGRNARHDTYDTWDLLELDGVTTTDSAIARLVGNLNEAGCTVHRRAGLNCWQIELPATWQQYVSQFSTSRRRKIRRLQTVAREKGVSLHVAQSDDERDQALRILVRLHQARRRSLGEPGCFAEEAFSSFFSGVVDSLGSDGSLQLAWIELDGQPIGADVLLASDTTDYLYQSGIDPRNLAFQPGHLSTLLLIERAIEQSRSVLDFLRGDEPYKASWGARPVPTQSIRVAANRMAPQIRHGVWLAGLTMKNWVKSGLSLAGVH